MCVYSLLVIPMVTMSLDEQQDCPLCMEALDYDDHHFYPCPCGYQVCRFCWTKILDEGNGLCPACRNAYNSEQPASFKPLSEEEILKIKKSKKIKEQQAKKQKHSDQKRCLGDVRVVQNNLVFVIGLPGRLADQEVLRGQDYFGKYGRVYKIAISKPPPGNSGSASVGAYVTFYRAEDAIKALLDLRQTEIDRRTLKASLGTTKYCSSYLKGQACTKGDCMYLHELGDPAASFTKDEMTAGKHSEYEEKLIAQHLEHTKQQAPVSTPGPGKGARGRRGKKLGAPERPATDPVPLCSSQSRSHSQDSSQDSDPWPSNSLSNSAGSQEPPVVSAGAPGSDLRPPPGLTQFSFSADVFPRRMTAAETEQDFLSNGVDDLDFDPFKESQRGLSECLQMEKAAMQQRKPHVGPPPGFSNTFTPHRPPVIATNSEITQKASQHKPPGLRPNSENVDVKNLTQALKNLFPNANVSCGPRTFNSFQNESSPPPQHLGFNHQLAESAWNDPAIVRSSLPSAFPQQSQGLNSQAMWATATTTASSSRLWAPPAFRNFAPANGAVHSAEGNPFRHF